MKREDIIKASFEYKREIELIEGNFQNNINLSSVAGAFREGEGIKVMAYFRKDAIKRLKHLK